MFDQSQNTTGNATSACRPTQQSGTSTIQSRIMKKSKPSSSGRSDHST